MGTGRVKLSYATEGIRLRKTALLTLVSFSVSLLMFLTGALEGFELRAYDLLSRQRNPLEPETDIVIIKVDQESIDALSKEELAAVLAHEVAHVSHRDGVASIKKSRWLEVAGIIGTEAAREFGSQDVSSLATLLEGSVNDVFKTLVTKGYGREQEYMADATALTILEGAGYNPRALADFLTTLKARKKIRGGLLKTHPSTKNRLRKVKENMPEASLEEDE